MDDMMECLSGESYFSKIDMKSGYLEILVNLKEIFKKEE